MSDVEYAESALQCFQSLLEALFAYDLAERANPRNSAWACYEIVKSCAIECIRFASPRLDNLAVRYLHTAPGEWDRALLKVVKNPTRAMNGNDYEQGVRERLTGLVELVTLVENDSNAPKPPPLNKAEAEPTEPEEAIERSLSPLTKTSEAVLTIIRKQPRGQGIQGKAIIRALAKQNIKIKESTLRKQVIPVLKEHYDVENLPSRGGYYDARKT